MHVTWWSYVVEGDVVAQKDAWRAYVELALGLTDTSRKKAMKIVQQVAGKGGATADQLQDLVNQGMANREAMTRMVRIELDRALGRVGLATIEEVEELNRRVRDLERELEAARGAAPANAVQPPTSAAAGPPTKTAARKTGAKKTVAKKTVAKKTGAPSAASTTAAAVSAAAPARKTTRAKTTRAKTTPAKAAARKTSPAAARKTSPAKATTRGTTTGSARSTGARG